MFTREERTYLHQTTAARLKSKDSPPKNFVLATPLARLSYFRCHWCPTHPNALWIE